MLPERAEATGPASLLGARPSMSARGVSSSATTAISGPRSVSRGRRADLWYVVSWSVGARLITIAFLMFLFF